MELGKDQATNTDVGYEIPSWHKWTPLAKFYHPLQAGSIDGTDTTPHDKAVSRATLSKYKPNKRVTGEPHKSLFVGKLSKETTEEAVFKVFSKCGDLVKCRLVRDVVTGFSKGYAFVEYRSERDATTAWRELHKEDIDGNTILVEYEAARTLKGWIPRRLGGGFGGKKESGQLRFGGRDRPFRRPIPIQQTGNQQKHLRGSQDHENDRPERENYRGEGERFRVKFSDNYRENYGNRERERDKNRSRENYSERERETSRSYRERDESNDGLRYRERDSERSRDNDRERDVNRERDESSDGSRYRERDSERSRDHDREHGGDRYKNRERYKDNEGSRSKGSHGHRERRRESRDSRDKRKESDHRREPEDNERL